MRLPKALLDSYGINDKVKLILKKDHILLEAVEVPRKGWESAFEKMHERSDDQLLMDDVFEDETLDEWM
ncbi:MAG: AbrB/MazE/SpoVT family DNA-binding domain-containing protein [Bacteroidales bacterium]